MRGVKSRRLSAVGVAAVALVGSGLMPLTTATAVVQAAAPEIAPTVTAVKSKPKSKRTKVVVKARSCKGCRLGVSYWTQTGPQKWKHFDQSRKVRKGKAVFSVPTRFTRGLTFRIEDDPKYTAIREAVPLVITGFSTKKGVKYRAKKAFNSTGAKVCWAGTKKRKVTVKMAAASRPGRAEWHSKKKTKTERVYWFKPSLKSMKTSFYENYSMPATQDSVDCFYE